MVAPFVRRPGFSLVELVIVVVIIGVLAAVAIPRISRGAKGAGDASLRGDLTTLRGAIDRYAAEHNGAWPAADKEEDTLIAQLTEKTDAAGNVGSAAGVHIYGPYLRSGFPPIPVGPNIRASGVVFRDNGQVMEGEINMGWVYNWTTGHIYANTNDLDERGVAYDTY